VLRHAVLVLQPFRCASHDLEIKVGSDIAWLDIACSGGYCRMKSQRPNAFGDEHKVGLIRRGRATGSRVELLGVVVWVRVDRFMAAHQRIFDRR
jgi:hypothetical protein